jgi:branched-chain amino acid transport system permease protein
VGGGEQGASITGGVDGLSVSRSERSSACFASTSAAHCVPVRARRRVRRVRLIARAREFAVRLEPARHSRGRQADAGDRSPGARRLRTIFTFAAAVAGVAGALLAQTTQFVGIDTLGFPRSAELMIMLVLGGTGRLYGGLVGAAIFMIAQDYLSGIDPSTGNSGSASS